MWRTNVQNQVSTCVTGSPVPLRAEVRAYLYANGRDGEYSETAYLLSKTVHSFTHETQVKRRANEGGEVQATLRDMSAG